MIPLVLFLSSVFLALGRWETNHLPGIPEYGSGIPGFISYIQASTDNHSHQAVLKLTNTDIHNTKELFSNQNMAHTDGEGLKKL
ncbi:Hypothetical predicted protein [Octopus vulgaris]|uniref:Uncharacterized protein n=1 Tax=Octopus vulgaris TaxID=6645 RepID=A0AA36AMD2_OCTVU|nr:Hypothetical predicted protein [Octopus vulgaris]